MNSMISVIIPTYNRANYLSEAIDSVLAQTYKNYEIIVVDDGSTDNTRKVLEKYSNKIRYIYQENKGPSAARNNGIKNAKGELIAFLDSDDAWLPEKLERQLELFRKNDELGLVSSAYYSCDEYFNLPTLVREKDLSTKRKILPKLFVKNLFATPTIVVKKKCFTRVGLFNENYKFGEDWDMWIRIALDYEVHYVLEPLCKCRRHNDSITYGMNPKNLEDWKNIIELNRKRAKNLYERIISIRKSIAWFYLNVASSCRDKEDIGGEKKYLVKSIVAWPFQRYGRSIALVRTLIGNRAYFIIRNYLKNR